MILDQSVQLTLKWLSYMMATDKYNRGGKNMSKNYPLNSVREVKNVKELMINAVKEVPDRAAFMYKEGNKDKQVSYKEFEEDTIALGTALVDKNVNDKHIACIGENSYPWITVFLTVLKSDGVFVPLDKELPLEQIIHILNDSDSEVLFYSERYEKFIADILQNVPKLKYVIGFQKQEHQDKVLSYQKLMEEGKKSYQKGNKKYTTLTYDIQKLKVLVYTSGTTGIAKGVMLSENNLLNVINNALKVADLYTKCLSVLPYHHTYEGTCGILLGLYHQATICINDSLKNVLRNIQFYQPDYLLLVPAFAEVFYKKIIANAKENKKYGILMAMMKVSNFLRFFGIDLRRKLFKSVHQAFGGNLREIICGGAPLRPELGKFFDSIGIQLINGYGITECSPLVSVNRIKFNDPRTVGIPLPCVEVKIVNPDEDGNGEIHVKGGIVMLGYYKNEEKTKEVLQDGWFNTGDYGNLNKKGQLSITGRTKNLIVLNNGKNVFPEEIENYILRVNYVKEVVVRGIKEEGREIGLLAEVFLNPELTEGMQNISETLKKDICDATRELPIYKKITEIKIRETEFEKTTTNKIKR